MDFITGLPRTHKKYDSIGVIVDRVTKSSHFLAVKTTDSVEDYAKLYINEIMKLHGVRLSIISDRGEVALIGPDSVLDAMEKVKLIRDRLKTAQSRQKSYADVKRMELEFQVDDWVFLKLSPITGGRLCVPNVFELRQHILAEAHNSRYFIHPGTTKMYSDVREVYWWNGMERDIADFVAKCPNCQQVKTDAQAERTIQTLEDMLRACVINFKGSWDNHLPLIEFAYNNSYHSSIQMALYEALYGRRCRSPVGWFEVGEVALIGPDSNLDAMEKVKLIRDRLKTAQSRQKSYADVRRRELEFQVDDWVFLKVPPMKRVMRFGKKGKLSARYVGPYRILKMISRVAYDPGMLRYQGRLCVPNVGELRQHILVEAHNSRYFIHPGATKMYNDVREVYWWNGMERDIADFVAKCPNCQQVKVEH
ncbi:hypothetical protein MTR67_044078 [Solanum verrucosum]|uniref:Integrase zinc-binding domain-containing protein n=1 Tax=Solanum verrucosum TaxID=315347 RepID=A0AAF0UPX2_SOLVR|nr:hypothetical protein MTR67_044078 [Solanum verrucosum]